MNASLETISDKRSGGVEVLAPLTPTTKVLIQRAKVFHAGIGAHLKSAGRYTLLFGQAMLTLKASVKHGEFEALVKEQFPELKYSTGKYYMSLTGKIKDKSPTVRDLLEQPDLFATPEITEEKCLLLDKAVFEDFDGGTITAIARQEKAIREPKKEVHTPARPASAKEKAEAEKAQAEQWLGSLRGKVQLYLSHPKLHTRLTKEQREEVDGLCLMVRNFNSGKLKGAELTKAIEAIGGEEESL